MVPYMQGGVGVAANEDGDEVIFVGVMKVWRNKFQLYAGITQKLFYAAGAFIFEHLVLGG